MLGNIPGASSALALLQSRLTIIGAKIGAASSDTTAKDKAASADEPVRQAQAALNAIKQSNAARKQQRKAEAKAKLERLKKELDALKLMGGGDPKAVARRAAQIARELATTAKEYAAASGKAGLALPTDGQGASAVDVSAAAGAVAATGTAGGGGTAQVQAEAAATTVTGVEARSAEKGEKAAEKTTVIPRSPEEERRATAERFQTIAAERQDRANQRLADNKFAAEVRRLFLQAKAIIQQQRQRAAQDGKDDDEFAHLAKQVKGAGETIEQTFSDAAIAAVAVPLNLQV